jgi:hypothetical protein
MPNLRFKTRPQGRTVQLVRHVYCPKIKRSRTVTLGSLPLDADPDDFFHALRLRDGVSFSDVEYQKIAAHLATEGDAIAARRRREVALRNEERIRAEVRQEFDAQAGDVFAQAVAALTAVAAALPELAERAGDAKAAMALLRPRYLKIHHAWEGLVKIAQSAGVAKRAQRSGKAKLLAPLPDIADA